VVRDRAPDNTGADDYNIQRRRLRDRVRRFQRRLAMAH
jgi:hypothetical protein